MAFAGNAPGRWLQMTGNRRSFVARCERYASYTLAKLCLPDGFTQDHELDHDYQAVGAQAVNHLANKIMLALFAPSRPFFRLDATPQMAKQLAELGVSDTDVANMLAQGEKAAIKQLDKLALRPKLYEAIKHLIVTGNILLVIENGTLRVVGIKRYAVRRSLSGKLLELMLADKVMFDELDPEVQEWARQHMSPQEDREVTLYRWIKRNAVGDYELTQWVDRFQLPAKFNGKWPESKLPYRVMTWDLADGHHYGTGLVEDYSSDFAGLSALSQAQVEGAVLASEFRWLVNPAGMTRPEDFENSRNGAALAGQEGDITLVQSGKAGDLQITLEMAQEYVQRIGRGFLLGSQQVRDAERVTQEEIRMIANELETSLGGAYSRLAVDFQIPLAYWLMEDVGLGIDGTQFEPTIVTGLDALSRTGDLEELKLWLADMAAISNLPPALQARLQMDTLATDLATPRRIDVAKYLKSEQQVAQEQSQARAAEVEQMGAETGIKAAAEIATQPQG